MKIGELAKVSGMPAHTIRFYERKGLLPEASRNSNGYRRYDGSSLKRLAIIQCAKRLGFSLEGILRMLANRMPTAEVDQAQVLQQLDVRLNEIDDLIKGLNVQREEIISLKKHLKDSWGKGACPQIDQYG